MSIDPFLGEIKILAFDFAPRGYLTCQGQILSITQSTALFALLGNYYGGDGQNTFALPDLRGRVPKGRGSGPGGLTYSPGQKGGTTTTTLVTNNLPAHAHTLNAAVVKLKAATDNADESSPDGNYPATTINPTYSGNGPTVDVFTGGTIVSGKTDLAGLGQPIDIMNPYLTLNYCIATEGIFPSWN